MSSGRPAGREPADRYAVGVGARPGVRADAVRALLARVVAEHGVDVVAARFATVAARVGEPGLREVLGELRSWPAEVLAAEPVPNPSAVATAAVGTPSVAEAAALCCARDLPGAGGAELVVPKMVGDGVTLAVAVAR